MPQSASSTVVVAKEINGIEMGVLDDGTAYFTGRGIARICGVVPSAIHKQSQAWRAGDRDNAFAKKLVNKGYTRPELHIPINVKGREAFAHPETVCMAFLDYYAFDASTPSPTALKSFRTLAQAGLRVFVYSAVGYDPRHLVPVEWRQFHDRLMLVSAPAGYFSVFKEAAEVVLYAIRGGLPCDQHTIPDISMGKTWSSHWLEKCLEAQHGRRIKYEHNYPDYFAQAASNPQDIWVYPVAGLGDFRTWLQTNYLPIKFPKYLTSKVKTGVLPASMAELLVAQSTLALPRQA